MQKEAEETKLKEKNKIQEYKQMCISQFEENKRLKEVTKRQEEEMLKNSKLKEGNDLLGQLF